MHGGLALDAPHDPRSRKPYPKRARANLAAHLDAAGNFEKPTLVAINQFGTNSPEELQVVHDFCLFLRRLQLDCQTFSRQGGEGAIDLAEKRGRGDLRPGRPL